MLSTYALVGILAAAATPGATPSTAARVEAIAQSVNLAWAERFKAEGRTYVPPRLLQMRFPAGHPAHGAGYFANVAVLIDLNDIDAIDRVFGRDGKTLNALLIAHEIGHHVQFVRAGSPRGRLAAATLAEELQADCYAGWWLATSPVERDSPAGDWQRVTPKLEAEFPRLLYLLSAVQTGRLSAETDPTRHGSPEERVAAVRRGLALSDPFECSAPPAVNAGERALTAR